MNPRVEYQMAQSDYDKIIEACQPVPAMMIGGYAPSQQENANRAWAELGSRMGFDAMTVRPGKSELFFTAVPSETPEQSFARKKRELEEATAQRVKRLQTEIEDRQSELAALQVKP